MGALLDELKARPHVAEQPPEDEPPAIAPAGREARKITALWIGLATDSARGTPAIEVLRRIVGRALDEVRSAVERHGGSVESVAGDALTAVFGVPAAHEDDALRAVRAAFDARGALSDLAVERSGERALELQFRIGISTGQIVTAVDAGTKLRLAGEPLTLSSRLGHAAGPGEISADVATQRLVRDGVVAEPVGDAWRVLELAGAVPVEAASCLGHDRPRA